jgi:hypothetical protein
MTVDGQRSTVNNSGVTLRPRGDPTGGAKPEVRPFASLRVTSLRVFDNR